MEAIPPGNGELILIVEDNTEVRNVARQRLQELRYGVVEADSGAAAVEILRLRGSEIKLVFSDVVMPGGMSGFDLARWVATNAQQIRIVLTSGYPDEIALAQEGNLPPVRLLRKPYSRMDLARAMHEAFKGGGST